ncbi:PREDICTED: solute carrier family 22 member 13-like [Nicrophorus vespilloides]|uniref:Solute carrier family 22 member 13-like n=1 Tax=Nicrophorus vespilloides TaxID=110193 RepID=A0ABM1MTD2_NICVS|nr:PREDICTED: solute carrier family 22 member 13-like [Nicrophorus vespilloides]
MVCGKESLVDVTQMTLMLGVLFGNIIFGVMADRIGRKKTLIASIIMQSACGMLSAWSPWLELFLVLRFLMAVANGGTMVTSFVMCMEVVGGIWRIIVPILYQIPFGGVKKVKDDILSR